MSPTRHRGRPRRARSRRRRLGALAVVLVAIVAVPVADRVGSLDRAVKELQLPLRYEDIIRQQAADKDLDPALIAAVIYQESRFRDQTSPAGAKGLMQILPGTARYIASKSGGTEFELRDLGTPQVNISYGSWYLDHLRDAYGDETLAIAAYNAGQVNVDRWVRDAGGTVLFDPDRHITFRETREYVAGVKEHRELYRERYERELGL